MIDTSFKGANMASILNLFIKSPFEPMFEHQMKVHECVSMLKPLFEALFEGNKKELKRITQQIRTAETEADKLKDEIRDIIPKGIFLPVNREDLLRYLKIQDDLADSVEDITVLISLKELTAPPELAKEILSFIDVVMEACRLGDEITDYLRTLVYSGFKGEKAQEVLKLVDKVNKAEHDSDKAGHELAKKLFAHEDEMKPSDLILWFRIFDLIGNLADHADNTGERLRSMISR